MIWYQTIGDRVNAKRAATWNSKSATVRNVKEPDCD